MALSTQVLQSETGGIDRQTFSLFRESSSVALQTSTDLKRLRVVTMVRRLAAQEHSVALAQLASCISANMKFGAGADDDPFVKETSCMNLTMRIDRIVAAVLISSPMAARLFYHNTVNSIWLHKWIGLDKDTFQIELQCMYAQMINICFTVQDETVENGKTRQERPECA